MKSHHSEALTIPEDIASRCDGHDQFDTFDRGLRTFLSVPKHAILKSETKVKPKKARTKKSATA